MLRELHVRNLAVVARASLELGEGLNALTGETGAGKSIVVDSLLLLAGARASTELIRTDAETLTVTGRFEPRDGEWRRILDDSGLAPESDDDELLVRREISRTGRNRVYINDQPATVKVLSDLAPGLLRIHGQREELGLAEPELQRRWLDRSGGEAAVALTARVAEAYAEWRRLADRLERLAGDERARRERLEILRFQAREIDAVKLSDGEEEELRREREALRHHEAIHGALARSCDRLVDAEDAAGGLLDRSSTELEEIARWEPAAAGWAQQAEELRIQVEELGHDLRARLDEIEADPDRLNQVEERLSRVERICRTFGPTSGEVLARRQQIAEELGQLEGDAEGRDELAERAAAALDGLSAAMGELSAARRGWGDRLAERIAGELGELGLGKARLTVELRRRRRADSPLELAGEAVDFGPDGFDHVVFLFAPNPGEAPRPLARIASGGELSRIYLALQLAVRGERRATAASLVFDEVDAGVGGAQAAALGKKLQRLAGGGQILVVTHLPQVASCADHHLKVIKEQRAGRTETRVAPLDDDARVEEIARMLAGEKITDLSRSHARELLARSARK